MNAPYKSEFGATYQIPQVVLDLIASGQLVDLSWHNDSCPSFALATDAPQYDLRLWIEHPDANERETPEANRFAVIDSEGVNYLNDAASDDAAVAVAMLQVVSGIANLARSNYELVHDVQHACLRALGEA